MLQEQGLNQMTYHIKIFQRLHFEMKNILRLCGRAHRPDRAVFYCATDHEVAIKEATQWHITDLGVLINREMPKDYNPHVRFVTVSIWKVKEDLKLASLFLNDKAME